MEEGKSLPEDDDAVENIERFLREKNEEKKEIVKQHKQYNFITTYLRFTLYINDTQTFTSCESVFHIKQFLNASVEFEAANEIIMNNGLLINLHLRNKREE